MNALLCSAAVALRQGQHESSNEEQGQKCMLHISEIYKDAASVFEELDQMVKKVKAKTSSSSANRLSKRTWLRRKSKIESLEVRVSALISSLTAALTLLQGLSTSSNTRQTTAKVDLVLSKVELLSQNSTQDITSHQLSTQMQAVLEELQKTTTKPTEAYQPRLVDVAPSRRSSVESFHSALSSSSDSSGTLISLSGTLEGFNGCEEFCPCRCHTNLQYNTPGWAAQLLGSIAMSGNGSVLLKRSPCNRKTCRKSGSTRIQVMYTAPAWTFLRYWKILITSEMMGRASPSLNIRLTNTIPNDAAIWCMIELGKVGIIRDMLNSGEASPHDVSPRGASLLKVSTFWLSVFRRTNRP